MDEFEREGEKRPPQSTTPAGGPGPTAEPVTLTEGSWAGQPTESHGTPPRASRGTGAALRAGPRQPRRKLRSDAWKSAPAEILNTPNGFWGVIASKPSKTRFLRKDQLDMFSYAQYSLQIINKAIKIRFPSKQLLLAYFFTFTLKDSILFSIH